MTVTQTSKYRRSIGALLTAAGLLGNPWVLGRVFAPDGSIDGESRIVLIVFVQLTCLFAGLALSWTRPPAWLRHVLSNAVAAAAVGTVAAGLVTGTGWGIWAYRSAHHHTTDMTTAAEPTPAERAWAEQFVQRSFDSAKRHGWLDFQKASADGFEKQWDDREHYFNRAYLFDDQILDPDRPEFLMYQDTPRGKLLVGFMFYGRTVEERGPRPGGALATWHFHSWAPRGYCAERGLLVIGRPDDAGNCAVGTHVVRSGEMLHVWFVDHPLGPYADAMVFPSGDAGLDITHLHPIAVHFSVALVVAVVLFDLLGWLTGRGVLHTVAFANLVLGAVATVAAVALGMAAEVKLLIGHDVHAVLDTHKLWGFTGLGAMLALLAWRAAARGRFPTTGGVVHLAAGIATAAAVLTAGYVGGRLVFDHGVAVRAIDRMALERHERMIERERSNSNAGGAATISGTNSHAGH